MTKGKGSDDNELFLIDFRIFFRYCFKRKRGACERLETSSSQSARIGRMSGNKIPSGSNNPSCDWTVFELRPPWRLSGWFFLT